MDGAKRHALDVRDYNERGFLNLLRQAGPAPGGALAKSLGVSAQTASVILRALEEGGYVERTQPIRGKVGKPQVPYKVAPGGAFGLGLRLGRRIADLALVNTAGEFVWRRTAQYPYPTPDLIDGFLADGLKEVFKERPPVETGRLVGIGVASPFELWNWLEGLGASKANADLWRGFDFETALSQHTDLPVYLANDVNQAAMGEVMFGIGRNLPDFAYFYVGAFVGGAVVLGNKVMSGRRGNAGAFGSIPVGDVRQGGHQLINHASIYRLEQSIAERRGRPVNLRAETELWTCDPETVDAWLVTAARGLAQAIVAVAATLDVSDIVLDGVFPSAIRARLCALLAQELPGIDQQGLSSIDLHEGELGTESGVLGAAFTPIYKHIFETSPI